MAKRKLFRWGAMLAARHRAQASLDRGWRAAVVHRDGGRCTSCGALRPLEADHVLPKSAFPELRHSVDNGRTLCRSCHRATPTYGHLAKRFRALHNRRSL